MFSGIYQAWNTISKHMNNKIIGIEQDQSVVALWYMNKGY